jgi:hypothetical protein
MANLGLNTMNVALNHTRNRNRNRIGLTIIAVMLSACASVGSGPSATGGPGKAGAVTPPSLGLFSSIKVPSDREPTLQLSAQGVQIFRCEKRDGGLAWVFRQPEAQLSDASGKPVGRHGASFSFEHNDGSRLVASVAAYDEAPNAADLRWLLLTTRSYGKGAFDGVTHVQRVNTRGGMPPGKCDAAQANQLLRVDFSADFVFYRARSGGAG